MAIWHYNFILGFLITLGEMPHVFNDKEISFLIFDKWILCITV